MKPMIFNTEMTRAILDGRKTVTRRPVKPQETDWEFSGMENDPHMTRIDRNGEEYPSQESGIWASFEWGVAFRFVKAPYQLGDILYVRETWAAWSRTYGTIPRILYKADRYTDAEKIKWRPSIHMPHEIARIFLRVTDVRVERLQDMNMNDVQAEGVVPDGVKGGQWQQDYMKPVWDSTIKPADRALYGWEANPWVWVIKFERIKNFKEADADE